MNLANFIKTLGKVLVIIILLLALLVASLFGLDTTPISDAIIAVLQDP
ncbi:hypothetical protein ACSU64_11690 [Bacillaceae bacterium C204]|jgi:hypothetical protein